MKRNFLFALILAVAVSCVGKIELPQHNTPPHLQGTEQEDQETPGDNEDDKKPEENPAIPPASGPEITVRFVSYNVGKFNKYKDQLGHDSYPEVAKVITEIGGDVVGLNETNKGQAKTLSEQFTPAWTHYFAYAANTSYGNSIIAAPKYKVVKEYPRVMIDKLAGASEIRSLGVVEYEDFVFCVTHLDHTSGEARQAGVKVITDWVLANYGPGKTSKPVILLGDMNCIPAEKTISMFKENWDWISANENSFPCKPGEKPTKCIDYILVLKNGVEYKAGESHAVHSVSGTDIQKASDHYPVYADVTFKKQK